ncbi:MAG: nicotinate-nucleotide--dimethylbenzimidazole phosphoribosyltransferase [Gammaproteobacteria bacterium]|nr:nicotinate-nucleotide--dimethylbenzimidazole phosphoribosyltransferase [Gammaproteobacteria bacterium]
MDIPAIQPAREQRSLLLLPNGALSRLEDIACWFSARQGKELPETLNVAVVIFAADHGTRTENIEPGADQIVRNTANGNAPINALVKQNAASLKIVDVGVAGDLSDVNAIEHVKIRNGSCNVAKGPAMTQGEYWEAVGIGEDMANQAIADGANLLIAGDISVSNHVSNTAVICELMGLEPEEVLDSGLGADHESYSHDLLAVEEALARAHGTPSRNILMELGGLETAAMAGFYRTAAQQGVPILLDGFTSVTAALAAAAWDVRIVGWMLASHVSDCIGHRQAVEELGLEPLVQLNANLNAAMGATMMIPVLQSALALHRGLITAET